MPTRTYSLAESSPFTYFEIGYNLEEFDSLQNTINSEDQMTSHFPGSSFGSVWHSTWRGSDVLHLPTLVRVLGILKAGAIFSVTVPFISRQYPVYRNLVFYAI